MKKNTEKSLCSKQSKFVFCALRSVKLALTDLSKCVCFSKKIYYWKGQVTANSTQESVTSEPKQSSDPSKLSGERLSVKAQEYTIGLECNSDKWLFHSKCFLNCVAIITQGDVQTGKYNNSNWNVQQRMREGHEKLFQRDILSFLTSKVRKQSLMFNSLNEYIRFGKGNSCK